VEERGASRIGASQHSNSEKYLAVGGKGLSSTNDSPMSDEGENSNAFAAALDSESIPPDESSLNYIGNIDPV
jgi:hypothetical protein